VSTGQSVVYHLALAGEWQEALSTGRAYSVSTRGRALAEVGFVHCAFAHQVGAVAGRFYADRDDLVVLAIDPSATGAELVVEGVPGTDEVFPHIYGPVPLTAVVSATPWDGAGPAPVCS
jgi:glutathione S-transferase